MAHAFLLQDWLHLEGEPGGEIVQDEETWIDISSLTDLVFYTSIKAINADVQVQLETAPAKDESLFEVMATQSSVTTVARDRILFATANPPPARWIRWKARSSGEADLMITFRVWVTGVATGNG